MQFVFLLILFVFNPAKTSNPKTGFADPSLDYPFVHVFLEDENLLIKFLNDMLEPCDNEKITAIEKGPFLYPGVKPANRLTVFDVSCLTKSGLIVVQVQLKHVYFLFVKEAQTDIVWKYYKEAEQIQNRYKARPVRLLIVSRCVLFPPETTPPLSRHKWMDERTHQVVFQDLSMTFFEIPKCKISNVTDIQSSVDFWCYFFSQISKASKPEISSLETRFPIVKKALNLLLMNNWHDSIFKYHDSFSTIHLLDLYSMDSEREDREKKLFELKKRLKELEKMGNKKVQDIAEIKKNITEKEEWLDLMKDDAHVKRFNSERDHEKKLLEREKAVEEVVAKMKKAQENASNVQNHTKAGT